MPDITRRAVLGGACASLAGALLPERATAAPAGLYGSVRGEPFPIPAAPLGRINPAYLRARVAVRTREAPGTIVIDPRSRYLYLVEGDGTALRYGVGVGRQGF